MPIVLLKKKKIYACCILRALLWTLVSFENTLMDSLAMLQKLWMMVSHRLSCSVILANFLFISNAFSSS